MMRLFAPLAILAAMAAVIMLTPAETQIAGLDHRALAGAATLLAMLIYLLSGARGSDVARVMSSVAVWAALLVALTGVYAYRFEAADFFDRVTAELLPSEPQVGQGGEVTINRRFSGEFAVAARVDGARVTFLFDTGASMVVLTAADARKAGIDTRGLAFDVPVATANGSALAAEIRLDQVAVGPILMRNVPALVARPGALEESLLGMSFLERLKSYTVERGRLILTAR
ncbi:MAG TPA: TIGR02281 family clan AA aspartic protease [Roseiarcus sp.]|nr:TIGR02281 family clan AA aspartic protease [Roseiarcus sp.]